MFTENCTELDSIVECLIGFVADSTIQAIKRATDDYIANWYYTVSFKDLDEFFPTITDLELPQHTKIFVKNSHYVWDPSRQRKLRRKLGNLIKSPKDTLDTMLEEHLSEVQDLLLEKKREYEETNDVSSHTDEQMSSTAPGGNGLRSPPLIGGSSSTRPDSGALRSPKMPPVGYFSVPSHSPRSPRSPLKRTFG